MPPRSCRPNRTRNATAVQESRSWTPHCRIARKQKAALASRFLHFSHSTLESLRNRNRLSSPQAGGGEAGVGGDDFGVFLAAAVVALGEGIEGVALLDLVLV